MSRFGGKLAAKRVANRLIAAAGYALGLPLLARRRGGLVVLTYHSVSPGRAHEMNVKPEAFAGQMEYLARRYTVLRPAEAAARLARGDDCRGCACVTFDDGYESVLEHALPVLARLGLPACMYVATGWIGQGRIYPHDAGDAVEYNRLLDWQGLRAWLDAGMEVGSHTVDHVRLSGVGRDEASRQVRESRRELEDRLGVEVHGFAYPYGSAADFTAASRRAVIEAGFRYAEIGRAHV